MNNFSKFLKNIFYFALLAIGILMVLWLIWTRFIRERLPKDIPFILSEGRFYILLYICFIYFLIIYSIIVSKEQNKVVKKVTNVLYLPLTTLDNFLKNKKFITLKYIKILQYKINPQLSTLRMLKKRNLQAIYIFFNILPRSILIFILLIEVFYFHRIQVFYSFIFIGILPLLHRYIKYSYRNIKEQYIYYLEEKWDSIYLLLEDEAEEEEYEENPEQYPEIIYNAKMITIREYIEIFLSHKLRYKYFASPQLKENYLKKYSFVSEKEKKDFLDELKSEFRILIGHYKSLESYYPIYHIVTQSTYIKWTRIFIFILYFICWLYILCISFHTLKNMPMTLNLILCLNENLQNIVEPFSQLPLDL